MDDTQFFKKYQKQLVWFINTKIGRWFFKVDEEIKNICNVAPNALTYNKHLERQENGEWREVKTTCFRTNNKYARLLNYRLAPLHKLALLLPSLARPELSPLLVPVMLTVDTYYPGSIATDNPVNGTVTYQSGYGGTDTWAQLISRTTGNYIVKSSTFSRIEILSASSSGKWGNLGRAFFCFDTSTIPDDDTIDSASLEISGANKKDDLSISPNYNIYSSNPASTTDLVNDDYDNFGNTSFSTDLSYSNYSTTTYNTFNLNSSGIANINKTGVSKFGMRNANYDVAATAPTWKSEKSTSITFWLAAMDGYTYDPKLTVTHSSAVNSNFFMLF